MGKIKYKPYLHDHQDEKLNIKCLFQTNYSHQFLDHIMEDIEDTV